MYGGFRGLGRNKMQMVVIHGSPLCFLLTIKQKCSPLVMVPSYKWLNTTVYDCKAQILSWWCCGVCSRVAYSLQTRQVYNYQFGSLLLGNLKQHRRRFFKNLCLLFWRAAGGNVYPLIFCRGLLSLSVSCWLIVWSYMSAATC